MSAYYNEHDSFAAAWLRELIKANQIAPGEVDERDIQDVRAEDLRGFTQCHFFAGIGVWSRALRDAGWPDDIPVWTGSCPCQGFSVSGKRAGFGDQRHLWPVWYRLIQECSPEKIFGEQISAKDGLAWFDVVSSDLENSGYTIGAGDICSASVGAPHIRQRLYFVAHSSSPECQGRSQQNNGPRESLYSSERDRTGELADIQGERCGETQTGSGRSTERIGGGGEFGELGDAASNGRHEGRTESAREQGRPYAAVPGQPSELGDAGNTRLEIGSRQEIGQGAVRNKGYAAAPAIVSSSPMEHTSGEQEGISGCARKSRISHWDGCEWIYCRDEKWRPVESGTFPLVTGTFKRVGRLRGYGNAITLQVAQAFIESYMEVTKWV